MNTTRKALVGIKKDLTVASLRAHVRGDVAVSAIALFLTILSLVVSESWISAGGGIAMSLVLLFVSWELVGQIREASNNHEGVLTMQG